MVTHYKNQKGFTLVELSIVIVIIGLIVAGVVAGQSLVKQAQVRSVVTEQEAIRVAVNAFKLEYNAVPGDFNNASSYWSGAAACRADPTAGNTVAVDCDGNGDKQILMAAGDTGESYMAWRHLSQAGLYSGSFSPGAVITGDIGVNIPASKFSGAGITLAFDESGAGATNITAGDGDDTAGNGRDANKNVMIFGGEVATDIANGTLFSPAQVLGIDEKVDDGNPTQGIVLGTGTTTEAAATCLASASAYNLDSTDDTACGVAFTF